MYMKVVWQLEVFSKESKVVDGTTMGLRTKLLSYAYDVPLYKAEQGR